MAWRVDEVDDMVAPLQTDRLKLDGYPPLPFQIHGVEVLITHVSNVDRACEFQQTIGEGGLAMINVGDDRRVTYALEVHLPPTISASECDPVLAADTLTRRPIVITSR